MACEPWNIYRFGEVLRQLKEERVADPDSDNDLFGYMWFWRDSRPLAMLVTQQDRDLYFQIAQCLIPGFNASGMMLCMEQYSTDLKQHPEGRKWKEREFQELHNAGRADEFHISENISVIKYTRNPGINGGRGCQNIDLVQRFKIDGSKVEWQESAHEVRRVGFMTDVINSYFELEPMALDDPLVCGPYHPDEIPHKRLHADLGSLRAINLMLGKKVQLGYFANPDDEEEMEIVEEAMRKMHQDPETMGRLIAMMTN